MKLWPSGALISGLALLASCASSQIGPEHTRRISVDWASRLYELEPFAYHPKDTSEPLFVRSDATPRTGLVIVPGKDRKIRALDARDGRVVWEKPTSAPNGPRPVDLGPHGAPEEVLVASLDGRVHRLSQRNGRETWVSEYPGTSAITASPAVVGQGNAGRVFVTSLDNRLTALSLETGKKVWSEDRPIEAELTISGQAGATAYRDMVITGFSDGTLVAFAQEDGATLWTADLRGPERSFVDVDTTPVVVSLPKTDEHAADTVVVAGAFSRGLSAVGIDDGLVRWTRPGEGFLTAIAKDGIVYAPQASGFLWAIDARSGKVLWVSTFSSRVASTPVSIGKYLVTPVGDGLTLIDRATGRQVVLWNDGRGVVATPAMGPRTLYVMSNGGLLYSLGIY
jgi:outer membrane protein assembly factor BamB